MKCRCGTINDDSATFCRSCGQPLYKNPVDKYLEIGYMPTSLAQPKSLRRHIFLIYFSGFITILGIIAFMISFLYMTFESDSHNECQTIMSTSSIFTIVFGIIFFYSKSKTRHKLKEDADYIQISDLVRRYPFIIKNDKMGVYSILDKKIVIPCEFNHLEWLVIGKILNGHHPIKGTIKIDILNNVLK